MKKRKSKYSSLEIILTTIMLLTACVFYGCSDRQLFYNCPKLKADVFKDGYNIQLRTDVGPQAYDTP